MKDQNNKFKIAKRKNTANMEEKKKSAINKNSLGDSSEEDDQFND